MSEALLTRDDVLLRFEQALHRQADQLSLSGQRQFVQWQPNSNRKHKVRRFIGLQVDGTPQLVAKVRMDTRDWKVPREYDVMRALARTPWGARGGEAFWGDDDGFIMRHVSAFDLPDVFRTADAQTRRRMVGSLVSEIARLHVSDPGTSPALQPDDLRDMLGTWSPTDPDVSQALASAPTGPMHGDLGPWNLRCDAGGEEVRIIDWEDYRAQGVPALDVLNALLTLTIIVHPDYQTMSGRALYEATFVRAGEMTALLGEGLRAYERLTGAPAPTVLALTPIFCRAMLRRFELEERPTAHLFYVPLLQHFKSEDAQWMLD